MDDAALAALVVAAVRSAEGPRKERSSLRTLVRAKLTGTETNTSTWDRVNHPEGCSDETFAVVRQALSSDHEFASQAQQLAERIVWRKQVLPRRDAVLAIGGAMAGSLLGVLGNWFVNPAIEPHAQEEVDRAAQEAAEAKGILTMEAKVQEQPDDNSGWAFPEPLSSEQARDLLALNGPPRLPGALAGAGAVRMMVSGLDPERSITRLRLIVTNQWPKPILITDLRAEVTRTPVLAGTLVWAGAEGGVPVIGIGFDLDEDSPQAKVLGEDGEFGESWTYGENVELEPGSSQPFTVVGRTTRSCCAWHIIITARIDGTTRAFRVNEQPFITTAFAAHYQQRFGFNVQWPGSWVDHGPGRKF
ncbi:hypothetical protein [Actinokineospora diospyrosa]|uniref:Uncharacterized protein n=1 Tax=Actinokineospora diospyrosa TaxID=103728 RepID=A0ABT1IDX4_9PSEU|nr:hypothetical protein [Actinokineospora diospyrosa]MCP2270834.1 hypothetical protein [Actinokineospora diospyrosa]